MMQYTKICKDRLRQCDNHSTYTMIDLTVKGNYLLKAWVFKFINSSCRVHRIISKPPEFKASSLNQIAFCKTVLQVIIPWYQYLS